MSSTAERVTPFRQIEDLTPFLESIAHSRVVMLGESSHGTHEFYEWRLRISQELIEKHGFQFIAVEGDWPPCWRVHRYVRGEGENDGRAALQNFRRWPTWMWANAETQELVEWTRTFNEKSGREIGFYGLDVYSLFESIESVIQVLQKINPFLARKIRTRYECFEPYRRNEIAYAKSLLLYPEGCEKEVMDVLQNLLRNHLSDSDDFFDTEQNARTVVNAERYYRAMIYGHEDSWNIRDQHMFDTLEQLLHRYGSETKGIVWAHNTHIGDYRATDMLHQGQINIGGLAREKWGSGQVTLWGFGTYDGDVIASHAWDGPTQRMRVPPGKNGSYEDIFHRVSEQLSRETFFLDLRNSRLGDPMAEVRGHRAIGVVYDPRHEQFGNYVPTALAQRYDGFLFFDHTTALRAFDQKFEWNEFPETWPQGM